MCTTIARWCGRHFARLIRSGMCNLLWGRWTRWITQRGCRILDRRWELMRRGSGRARDLRGHGRMRCWWMKRRRRVWQRCGKIWGFERRSERRRDLTQSALGKSTEDAEKTAETAQVVENIEIGDSELRITVHADRLDGEKKYKR